MTQIPATPTVNDLPPLVAPESARKKYLVRLALSGALCMALCAPAVAEWKVIQSEAAHFVEFDANAVRESPPLRLAWTRITFTKLQNAEGPSFQSQGQLHAVDCAARKSTVVGLVNYSGALGQGEPTERQTRPRTEWIPKAPPPESLAALIIDLSCRAPLKR